MTRETIRREKTAERNAKTSFPFSVSRREMQFPPSSRRVPIDVTNSLAATRAKSEAVRACVHRRALAFCFMGRIYCPRHSRGRVNCDQARSVPDLDRRPTRRALRAEEPCALERFPRPPRAWRRSLKSHAFDEDGPQRHNSALSGASSGVAQTLPKAWPKDSANFEKWTFFKGGPPVGAPSFLRPDRRAV